MKWNIIIKQRTILVQEGYLTEFCQTSSTFERLSKPYFQKHFQMYLFLIVRWSTPIIANTYYVLAIFLGDFSTDNAELLVLSNPTISKNCMTD